MNPCSTRTCSAGSNPVALLPVRSSGGFGLPEAGFTGIVAWFDAPAGAPQ